MTPEEQKELAKELADFALKKVLAAIDSGKVPEWDGVELRWYMIEQLDWSRHDDNALAKRKREYLNTVAVRGL